VNVVCVFCGSSPGNDPARAASARTLGRTLAERGTALVYGGHGGLMGVVANAALGAGG
jgi:predicted Rossmann-fold nucleotide-binding protein